jgi:hypothetical protein
METAMTDLAAIVARDAQAAASTSSTPRPRPMTRVGLGYRSIVGY